MTKQKALKRGLQVVTTLFGAFGSGLHQMAPPFEQTAQITLTVSSFGALLAFLFVLALLRHGKPHQYDRAFLFAAGFGAVLFLISTGYYHHLFSRHVYMPDPSVHQGIIIRGKLTPTAQECKEDLERRGITATTGELIRSCCDEIGHPQDLWDEESIRKIKTRLFWTYLLLTLSLCGAIFCLVEGLIREPPMGNVRM